MRKVLALVLLVIMLIGVSGCSDASVASRNLSQAADMFEIERRVVFYNGITDVTMLSIEGRCSIEDQGIQLELTCKIAEDEYLKHFLGLSDNVTYFVEQIGTAEVDVYRYRRIFKPEAIVPDIDLQTSLGE